MRNIIFIFLPVFILLLGCEKPTNPQTPTLSLSYKYSKLTTITNKDQLINLGTAPEIDSITVIRARLVLSRIKFKSQSDNLNFKTTPFVLDLDLSGRVQSLMVTEISYRTFCELEFKIHRLDSSDVFSLPQNERNVFADFITGENYSIIIEGKVYRNIGTSQAYTYKSKIDVVQKHSLTPEVIISEAEPSVNVTLLINSSGWFEDRGNLMNPLDETNYNKIDQNLKSSIKVFKDNNRDGRAD